MCDILQIPRSTYDYHAKERENNDDTTTELIVQKFKDSRNICGQRKIKKELHKLGYQVSRRRISRIMKKQGLISKYTVAQYKGAKSAVNESKIDNILNRNFTSDRPMQVVVSDLTYVRVKQNWHYICILVDLYNRELISHSTGPNKDETLVYHALSSIPHNLHELKMFHTDRGKEFDNNLIDQALEAFNI